MMSLNEMTVEKTYSKKECRQDAFRQMTVDKMFYMK